MEGTEHTHAADATAESDETEEYEINVDVSEDNLVVLHSEDWELYLSPAEARMLSQALEEAASEAEGPTE
ncbi:MAG: hypothetical protein ACK47B_26810 [Armatimonadota bacterium]